MHSPALLMCRIGWHAASADGVWNGGYCFTRCRRCGRDMVRSVFGEWHVPRGFRVVWRDVAPRSAPEPAAPQPAVLPPDTLRAAALPSVASEPVPDPPQPEQHHQAPIADDLPFVARSPFDFSEFDEVDGARSPTGRRPAPPPSREPTRSRR